MASTPLETAHTASRKMLPLVKTSVNMPSATHQTDLVVIPRSRTTLNHSDWMSSNRSADVLNWTCCNSAEDGVSVRQ
eukprot:1144435-Lingulodinium_polyedra.AAC.1